MRELKLYETSRYRNVPKIYEDDFGFMVMPFCPEFTTLYNHTVTAVDTISSIARQYYGDSKYQWAVLSANELPFPPKLEAGTVIVIPSPDEVLQYVR